LSHPRRRWFTLPPVESLDKPHPGERAERIRVSGRVQGVGFRASAQHLALQYGVRGWVANIGRDVVIHACGPAERLEQFVQALRDDIGPPARIDGLQREPAELLPRGAAFVIAPTDTPLARR